MLWTNSCRLKVPKSDGNVGSVTDSFTLTAQKFARILVILWSNLYVFRHIRLVGLLEMFCLICLFF